MRKKKERNIVVVKQRDKRFSSAGEAKGGLNPSYGSLLAILVIVIPQTAALLHQEVSLNIKH
jgi:hypothetical protein